jgi:hypothetical protein
VLTSMRQPRKSELETGVEDCSVMFRCFCCDWEIPKREMVVALGIES